MAMTKPSSLSAAFLLLLLLLLVMMMIATAFASTTTPACNPTQLTPCAGPVLFGGPVSPACCVALDAQRACLCGYARSPNYGSYVRSPNAARLFAVCRIPLPRCR
ncbi:hypothetical protein PR202_ga22532 [Eleusine coracana subsp. coracana]|uniref:Bifunctional inhibitor/plant lipid transfer protein/seed storage helical domain-containing protein n=1 Tax=Eleusine coracana subsp. coracana TaxID=191504 RepID=A0AAV5D3V9_ELECO|nr:hypothetical protein QOZ80_9AG0689860 [Eleusine coracana subsp. coracana]GJN04947.1 hypothetical protein PR202_ga22532 [Eleusine coracana subsp. coracana]